MIEEIAPVETKNDPQPEVTSVTEDPTETKVEENEEEK